MRLPTGTNFAHFAFRPDGKLFGLNDDTGTLRLWDVRRDHLVGSPVKVSIGSLGGPLAFGPDGTRIALIAYDKDINARPEIWDVSDWASPTRQFYMPTASAFYS